MSDYDDVGYAWPYQQEIEHRQYEETIMSSTVRVNVDHLINSANKIPQKRHQMRCARCKSFVGVTGCKKCNQKGGTNENN